MMDLFAPLLAFVGGYVGTRLLTRAYNVNADWRARRLLRRAWPPELPKSRQVSWETSLSFTRMTT